MTQDIILETTMDFILGDEKHLAIGLQIEKAMPHIKEKLLEGVMECAKLHLEEWCTCEMENWTVSPLWDSWLILRKNEWPETNDAGWDVGVVILSPKLKVHLPDSVDLDSFKERFEKAISERTTKWTNKGSSLVEQPYDLYTEENLKKCLKKDEIAYELAQKMKDWATAVEKCSR